MMRSQLRISTRLVDRRRPPRIGREPPLPPPSPTREEITPSSVWTQDSNSHYLLLQFPGYNLEEIKMKIEGTDRVKITGERKDGEKIIFVDKTYTVPENSDVERTSSKLEDGTFTVTVPKRLPPPPVQEPVQEMLSSERKSTDKDANSLSDIEDLKKESDGEDEKLKDQAQQQQEIEKGAGDLKKESDSEDEKLKDQAQQQQEIEKGAGDLKKESDDEDQKQLKDQEQRQQESEKDADNLKKVSDCEDEKQLKDQEESDRGEDGKLKDQEQQKKKQENETKSTSEEEEEQKRGASSEKNQFSAATQMICKSKNTIFISLIAFCLGVLVSRKMGH